MAIKKAKSTNSKKTPTTSRKTTRPVEAPMIIRDTPMIVTYHPAPTEDEIAKRAFLIFERRGYSHGCDMEDWFQAERELRQGI